MIFKIFAVIGLRHFYRAAATCFVPVCFTFMFVSHALAADKQPCDCMDVKLEPSKERIKITRAKEVNRLLQTVEKNNPTKAELLKRQVATASTFLQRHMNGDLYQDQAPDDWDAYNGPIMAMSMTEWMHMKSEKSDKDYSQWAVCPRAQMEVLTPAPNRTVIRYEFVIVGRSVPQRLRSYNLIFSDVESGNPFSIEVTVDDQAKVTEMRQIPQGSSSYPYLRSVRFLKQRVKKVPVNETGKRSGEISADNVIYSKEISAIEKAAKVCAATTNTGK